MAVGDINSSAVGSGARYNDNKIPYELIPTHLLESTARVLGVGAKKYAPWNWAKGMKYSVVIGCIKRHLSAIERGEDIDPESGFRHAGHIMCNLLFLEHYMNMKDHGGAWKELDDRPHDWFNTYPVPEWDTASQRNLSPEDLARMLTPGHPTMTQMDLTPKKDTE